VSCNECGVSQECGEEWGHGKTWNTRHIPEGYALVPVEPTRQMISAAEDAYMPFGDMALALQVAIAEAQGA
jgi:surface antigen